MLRQVIGLAALYLATIVATQYYVTVSNTINNIFYLASSRMVNVISFSLIFFSVSAIINFLAADAYQMTKLRLFPLVDQLGGAFIGLVTIVILLVVLLPILQFVSGEPMPLENFEKYRAFFIQGIQTSRLVPAIIGLRGDLLKAITPWLPNGQTPPIFNM